MKCTTPGCQLDARPRTAPSGPAPTKCKPCFSKSPSAKNVRTLPERVTSREQARPVVEVRTDASVRNAFTIRVQTYDRLREAVDAATRAVDREMRRLRDIATNGTGPWRCASCGPLAQNETPVHGLDEALHCPRCDGSCTALEPGDAKSPSKSAWRSAPATGGGE